MAKLKRELGLFESSVYGIGLILGAGIYAIIGEAVGLTGESIVFSFLIAAIIAGLTGLSYAELSSLYPKEEGNYIYVKTAFGIKALSNLTALLRIFVGIVSTAAVALAFGGYLSSFVNIPLIYTAAALILVLSCVNFYGIDFSAKINVVFTCIEVLGLLIIIWIGTGSWFSIDPLHLPQGFTGLLSSAFLIFFAYIGFESIVNISEETKDASKTIPKAIIISIIISTILYILVAVSSVGLVNWQILGGSTSPLATVAMEGWGPQAFGIISLIALFSTTNTVLIILISTSRVLYGVSKKQYHAFPHIFSKIHKKRKTPYISIFFIMLLSMAFVLLADIGIVAGLANLFFLMIFVLVNASLIKTRFKYPKKKRAFTAPLNIGNISITALGGLIACIGLIVFYMIQYFV